MLSYLQVGEDPYTNLKIDLNMTSFQNDCVNGAVFTFTNGFASLFWGFLADKYTRRYVWIIACACWTGASFLISFTETFGQILTVRIVFAIFMATSIPYSVSMLSDYTMPHERGLAQSIFAAGIYLGVGMSSLSIFLDNAVGWRNAVRIVCAICVGFLVPQVFVSEPKRNATNMLAMQGLGDDEDDDVSSLLKLCYFFCCYWMESSMKFMGLRTHYLFHFFSLCQTLKISNSITLLSNY